METENLNSQQCFLFTIAKRPHRLAAVARIVLELLASCLINARALLEYIVFILWVCFVSNMLPSVKFAEDKVLAFLVLRGIVEPYIVFITSGSIKEHTQTSTEMGISCQRNGYWAATNHLSGRGLVQPIKD